MSLIQTLTEHLTLCDELHQLCIEENRILKQQRHAPDAAWRERKQALAVRFEASLQSLRNHPHAEGEHGGELLERTKQRSLQILHLDRENEQLLLRCSLAPARPETPQPISSAGALKAYGRSG
jgi:hypothetical protein